MASQVLGASHTWLLSRAVGADYTYTLPAGALSADWYIIVVQLDGTTGTTAVTVPSMTKIREIQVAGTRWASAFAKARAAETTVLIQWTTGIATKGRVSCIWGTGPAPDQWVIGAGENRSAYGVSPRNWTRCPSITNPSSTAEMLAIALAYEVTSAVESPDSILSSDNGMTQNLYTPQGATAGDQIETLWVGSKLLPASGASGLTQVLYRNVQDTNGYGFTIGIPSPVADPAGPGFPVYKGNKAPAKLYRMTASGPRTPLDVRVVHDGYGNFNTMKSAEFWWAHRGGSASFPEHSMHAYTQSILRGYRALEISLNRTSDGVWFGLHDQNLDRTSGVSTGFTDAAQMTWAQVQSYQITLGPGAPQPYMKWDDLIATYGSSHILICDPKHRFSDRQNEFLDKCLADIGTERCIVKGFYDMNSLRTAAKARGLKTWGYSYAASIDGDVNWATKANGWDLQGMEWSAAQTYWDQVKALGVPVVAHICNSEAAVTTARSKGAAGFQCSTTTTIRPFSP